MTGITYTFATQTGPIPLSELDTNFALMTNGTLNASFATVTATTPIGTSSQVGAFNYGTLSYNDVNVVFSAQGSTNSYFQKIIQNTSNGAAASTDYIVSNNLGTASAYYGNFGINSSTYAGTGAYNLPNAVYLSATSGDLALGTTTANGIHFFVNNGATDALAISSAGVVSTTTPATSDSSNTVATTAFVNSAMANAVPGRNKIINGDMRVAQRGASGIGGGYCLDRWFINSLGSTPTYNQYQGINFNGIYGNILQINGVAGNTAYNITQRMESINTRDLAGFTATYQYWFYQNSAILSSISTSLAYANTTDNFGSTTGIATNTQTGIVSGWNFVTGQFAIPSAATTGLQITLNAVSPSLSAGQQMAYGNVQFEKGSIATQFEVLDYGVELGICKRYYETLSQPLTGMCYGATDIAISVPFTVQKRANPTILYTASSGQWIGGGISGYITSFTTTSISQYGAGLDSTALTGSPVVGQGIILRSQGLSASAEL